MIRRLRWLIWLTLGEPVKVRIYRRALIRDWPIEVRVLLLSSPDPELYMDLFVKALFNNMSECEKQYCDWRAFPNLKPTC